MGLPLQHVSVPDYWSSPGLVTALCTLSPLNTLSYSLLEKQSNSSERMIFFYFTMLNHSRFCSTILYNNTGASLGVWFFSRAYGFEWLQNFITSLTCLDSPIFDRFIGAFHFLHVHQNSFQRRLYYHFLSLPSGPLGITAGGDRVLPRQEESPSVCQCAIGSRRE